jgi:uncharacterized membrane protein
LTRAGVMRALRRYLMAGLLVWIPVLATVLVLRFIIDLMDRIFLLLPAGMRPEVLFGVRVPGLGAIFALLILVFTGLAVTNIIGRTFMGLWDDLLARIPFVRAVYGGVKSFSETIFSNSGNSFKKVLLIEYPRQGIWSVGFQTAADVPVVSERTGEQQVCVFIPTTPNPTSGFIMMLPRSQVIELDMSVDAAMKMIVTLGVVTPPSALAAATHRPGAG